MTYSNVLLDETGIGTWTGGTQSFAIPSGVTSHKGADRYAVIVRGNETSRIYAASYI